MGGGIIYHYRPELGGGTVRVVAGQTTTMHVRYIGTSSVVLNISRTSANAPINVRFNGTQYTAPGRYVINYLNPGWYPLESSTTYNHGIAFHPYGANEVWLRWSEQTVQVDVVYAPENRAVLQIRVEGWYIYNDPHFANNPPNQLWLLQNGSNYRHLLPGWHSLTLTPGMYYSLNQGVGYEYTFRCEGVGCFDSWRWRLVLVERLPLGGVQAGEVYTARVVWKAVRCNWWGRRCWDG
jgi:hypothetical protein